MSFAIPIRNRFAIFDEPEVFRYDKTTLLAIRSSETVRAMAPPNLPEILKAHPRSALNSSSRFINKVIHAQNGHSVSTNGRVHKLKKMIWVPKQKIV